MRYVRTRREVCAYMDFSCMLQLQRLNMCCPVGMHTCLHCCTVLNTRQVAASMHAGLLLCDVLHTHLFNNMCLSEAISLESH